MLLKTSGLTENEAKSLLPKIRAHEAPLFDTAEHIALTIRDLAKNGSTYFRSGWKNTRSVYEETEREILRACYEEYQALGGAESWDELGYEFLP